VSEVVALSAAAHGSRVALIWPGDAAETGFSCGPWPECAFYWPRGESASRPEYFVSAARDVSPSRCSRHVGAFCSSPGGACRTSAMDGSDLNATALRDDRIGCRRGERRVEVRRFQDVDASNHLT
jgi:hypothetical protein